MSARTKLMCPFTDKTCKACKALFTNESGEKSGTMVRGCQLLEKPQAGKPE